MNTQNLLNLFEQNGVHVLVGQVSLPHGKWLSLGYGSKEGYCEVHTVTDRSTVTITSEVKSVKIG